MSGKKVNAIGEVDSDFIIKISPPVIYFVRILKNDIKLEKRLQNDIRILFRYRLESMGQLKDTNN